MDEFRFCLVFRLFFSLCGLCFEQMNWSPNLVLSTNMISPTKMSNRIDLRTEPSGTPIVMGIYAFKSHTDYSQ